jgi:hypothetical protein
MHAEKACEKEKRRNEFKEIIKLEQLVIHKFKPPFFLVIITSTFKFNFTLQI